MPNLLNFLSGIPMKKKTHTSNVNNFIKFLPTELLTEILAQVASTSTTDLINSRLSCREFLKAGNDDYIFQHASLDKFPIAWPVSEESACLFLERCKKSGNAEALFRQGMLEYFSLSNTKFGLQLLEKAAKKKHAESIYIYSIILLCYGNQFKEQGAKLLSSLTSSKIRECRKNIKRVVKSIWVRNIIAQEEDSNLKTCNCFRKKNGWEAEEEVIGCSQSCLCISEVTFFCNLLKNSSAQL